MPRDSNSSLEIINYRLDTLEKRLTFLEQKIDLLSVDNNSSSNKINMEILNILMSYIKSDQQSRVPVCNDNKDCNKPRETIDEITEATEHKNRHEINKLHTINRLGTL